MKDDLLDADAQARHRTKPEQIRWIQAEENNLRAVDLAIPANALVCVAGVSGSGKSSLLEGCLAAEAMRRHQVLSRSTGTIATPYSPRVRGIVAPYVVSVRQGVLSFNQRSTVGTVSGLLQPLRQVLARSAQVRGSDGLPVPPFTLKGFTAWCNRHRAGRDIYVMARLGGRVLGPLWPRIEAALTLAPGFDVASIESGDPASPETAKPALSFRRSIATSQRDVYAVFALPKRAAGSRLLETLNRAAQVAGGSEGVQVCLQARGDADEVLELGEVLVAPHEDVVYRRPSTTLLSFNSRLPHSGRCPACDGLGQVDVVPLERLISEEAAPIAEGGLRLPYDPNQRRYKYLVPLSEELRGLLAAHGLPTAAKWGDIPRAIQAEVLHGSGARVVRPLLHDGKPRGRPKPFRGVLPWLEEKLRGADAGASALAPLRERGQCASCSGSRLTPAARAVHFAGRSYDQVLALPIGRLEGWLRQAAANASPHDADTLRSLAALAKGCGRLGLGHLSLGRSVTTLSGGEGQRLRIAAALSTHLEQVCYALDEPSRGLHAADAVHLVEVLRELVSSCTTVLVAEHNPTVVAAADHVVELGPRGGPGGGSVIYSGPAASAPFLCSPLMERHGSAGRPTGRVVASGVTLRTLRDQTAEFPLGAITAITGVSGSGKTTLVRDVLVPALMRFVDSGATAGPHHQSLRVLGGRLDRVNYVPQVALSNNPRSSVLTRLGLGEGLRDWFFRESGAAALGLSSESLNPNSAAGRCPSCEGLGRATEDAGDQARCPACGGSRLAPAALWARLGNRTIAEWLEMPLSDLAGVATVPTGIQTAAALCCQLGLGHLALGRSLPTLSGGEAQRLRICDALLAARQQKGSVPHQLFVMDEPAAGLHPQDVARLQTALDAIVAGGANTVVLVEHNLDLVRHSDWIVDLGPGAADDGGRVLWCGSAREFALADLPQSRTRAFLTMAPQGASTPAVRAVAQPRFLEPLPPREAVRRFRSALIAHASEADPDDAMPAARPAYAISAGDGEVHGRHDVLALLGLALPLYRIFAQASTIPEQPLLDETQVVESAIEWASHRKHVQACWHPLVSQAQHYPVTDEDLRAALRSAAKAGVREWYDGEAVRTRSPGRTEALDLRAVRLLLAPALKPAEAIARAMVLGQGWFSLLDVDNNTLRDFTSRALHPGSLRVGQRWNTPQAFDALVRATACPLCRGGGRRTVVDDRVVVRDARHGLDDDRLFTPEALAVLRSSRRKRMAPAVARLKAASLIDLSGRVDRMTHEQRVAFWFGFPDRKFLRPGGDPAVRGDWYSYRGIYREVLEDMWKGPDRVWSQRLKDSTRDVPCPRCDGTGLGWEARSRAIRNVSMQTVKASFDIARLRRWLADVTLPSHLGADLEVVSSRLDAALRVGLGQIRCGASLAELSALDRLRAVGAGSAQHELSGALAVVDLDGGLSAAEANDVLEGLQARSRMEWVLDP